MKNPSDFNIADQRMPVWEALSEFFLDTELSESDYTRIATELADSPYSESELKNILDYEVYPVCGRNLLSMAGEWSGFDPEWLKSKCSAKINKRPLFPWLIFGRWMYMRHWDRVVKLVREARSG